MTRASRMPRLDRQSPVRGFITRQSAEPNCSNEFRKYEKGRLDKSAHGLSLLMVLNGKRSALCSN